MVRIEVLGRLSAVKVRNTKPKEKVYKLSDGRGLNLEIYPNGSKYWRLYYRYKNKQKTLALGVYPIVPLAKAREKMIDAKQLLDAGIDPAIAKKRDKANIGQNTFEPIAREWFEKQVGQWTKGHADKVWQSLKSGALPDLRNIPIHEITSRDVLRVIRKIEERGALDVAARVKQRIGSIFRYAIQVGYAEYNPVDSLKDVLKKRRVQHRKSLKQSEIHSYLNSLDEYRGSKITRYALEFIAHTFIRPGELRSAEWRDIDLDNAEWRLPAEKMKMNEEHIVPLSQQMVVLLDRAKELTRNYDLVFPSSNDYRKKMSENTLNDAIQKRLKFEATAHGFRATASTILNEAGFPVDVIERQLAHAERNKVRAAYNRSQYLQKRVEMMQWYSNHLDELKSGANVLPIHRKA